jgi:DAK2 domain fusion protein YloV
MRELNGVTLKEMLISGANNLYNNYPSVDALNVFPVPDGDTGLNMNSTMTSGIKEIANRSDTNIYQIAKSFSYGLLLGTRGNSGAITTQIFRGFANSVKDKEKVNAVEFADAWLMGQEVAYKAVMRPVEGTILTVIRESAQALADNVNKDWTIERAFEFMIKEAKASLERTPDLLPVLKEVGVVDSGGAGLVIIFEGMYSGLIGKMVEKTTATAFTEAPAEPLFQGHISEDEEFGYCTEFILRIGGEGKRPFDEKRFMNVIKSQGNSIVMVHDEDILKIHVHTLKPGNTLNYAQQFGEFVTLKIENMTEQHHHLTIAKPDEEPEEEPVKELKRYGIIAVASGEGISDLFKQYRVDYVVKGGQTMNPSTEDFVNAIRKVGAKDVFILPNNSNIILAANQAMDIFEEDENIKAHVITSKTIMEGLVATMNFNPDNEVEMNIEDMTESLGSIKTGEVTYAIKDTQIDGVKVKKDYYMGLNGKSIVCSVKDKFEAAHKLIEHMVDDMTSIITIICGEDIKAKDAENFKEKIEEKYEDIDVDLVMGGQPVYSFIIGIE